MYEKKYVYISRIMPRMVLSNEKKRKNENDLSTRASQKKILLSRGTRSNSRKQGESRCMTEASGRLAERMERLSRFLKNDLYVRMRDYLPKNREED